MTRREAAVQVYLGNGLRALYPGWTYDEAPGLAIADGAPVVRNSDAVTAYSVTHVPTGCALMSSPNFEPAERTVEAIRDLADWPNLTYPVSKEISAELEPVLARHEYYAWMVLNP